MEPETPPTKTRSRRRWIGAAIVGVWLLGFGLLIRREYAGSLFLAEPGAAIPAVGDVAYAVLVPGRAGTANPGSGRVGEIRMVRRLESRNGFGGRSANVGARLALQLLGKETHLEVEGDLWRPDDPAAAGKQVELDFRVRSHGHDFRLVAELAGGRLQGEVRSAGETLPLDLRIGDDVMVESGLGASLRFPTMEVGETLRFDSFDPLTLSSGRAKVTCLADETLMLSGVPVATKRLQVEASGIGSVAWIDELGEVVRAETPLGLVLERLPAGTVATAFDQGSATLDGADFLGQTSIQPTGLRPRRGARRLVLRLSGADLEAPTDSAQRRLAPDDASVLEVLSLAPQDPAREPAPNSARKLALPSDTHLASDPFVQSTHREIIGRAKRIVGDETDPWRRAQLLNDWVFEHIDKEPVVSIPSALEVLRQRRGDCNEHTVLYTALARAIGLPTRIAIGLVWSDELGGFYYHAWPEVFLEPGDEADGGWVRLDPTLGQPVADATHIKLLEGGIETWPRLLAYLGKLDIAVLEMEMETDMEPAT